MLITSHPNTELGYADPSESSASICYLPRPGAPSASNIDKVRSNLRAAFKHLLALSTPMKLYSAHGCCCFSVCHRTEPNRRSCTFSRCTTRTLLRPGCSCTCAMGSQMAAMKVCRMSKVGVLGGCFLSFGQPLFHDTFSPPSPSCTFHLFLFEFISSFLDLRSSHVRYALLHSSYTGRLTQFHLPCSSNPASSRLSRNFLQLQIHPPRHHPSGPTRSHFNRTHHRERVGLSFVCNNFGHVEKIRGGTNNDLW